MFIDSDNFCNDDGMVTRMRSPAAKLTFGPPSGSYGDTWQVKRPLTA